LIRFGNETLQYKKYSGKEELTMRNTNRKRVLLVSSSVILLCLSVIVGMTWALFSDTVDMNHHLKAGTLNITLERTKLSGVALDPATGYLVPLADLYDDPKYLEKPKDFSDTKDNVFELTTDTRVIPGTNYVAEMEITNNSDVAFVYWVEIQYNQKKSDPNFAQQVEVIVDTDLTSVKGEKRATLNNGLFVGSETKPIGTLAKGESAEFSVKVEFEMLAHAQNDLAQNKDVDFDLVVHAVQVNPVPSR
jgi:hypothetical protein